MREKFLLTVMNGWTLRNLGRSQLWQYLNDRDDLFVVCPENLAQDVREVFPKAQRLELTSGRIHQLGVNTRKNIWYRLANNVYPTRFLRRTSTFTAKRKYRKQPPFQKREIFLERSFVGRLLDKGGFALLRLKFQRWVSQQFPELRHEKFHTGLSLSANATFEDFLLTNAVGRLCRRSLAYVLSWDNPSTKPYWLPPVDELLVWGHRMEADLRRVSREFLGESRIHRVGALQFDWHFADPIPTQADLAIEPPFIFYACVAGAQFPDEPLFLERCIELLSQDHPEWNWLIRVHPKENGSRFEGLRSYPQVTLDIPNTGSLRSWRATPGEKERLKAAIAGAGLICTSFGTLALESLIYGKKPILVAAPNADGSITNAADHLNYHHIRSLLATVSLPVLFKATELPGHLPGVVSSQGSGDLRSVYRGFFVNSPGRTAAENIVAKLKDDPLETRIEPKKNQVQNY